MPAKFNKITKFTTKYFIQRAIKVHGNKYDYSKVVYVNAHIKIIIICPIHGEFLQRPQSHLDGAICLQCKINSQILTTRQFVSKSILLHENKYGYKKTVYTHHKNKVIIYCRKCKRYFEQVANYHLCGCGCPFCSGRIVTSSNCLKKTNPKLAKEWDYNKNKSLTPRDVTSGSSEEAYWLCHVCGYSWMATINHRSSGCGCLKCANKSMGDRRRSSKKEFVEKAIKIHDKKYQYNKVNYKNGKINVAIYCKKCKNYFYQSPNSHLSGHGCPRCHLSKIEINVENILKKYNIKFEKQKRFNTCKNKKRLPFDFYLPEYNMLFECQGNQHYKYVKYMHKFKKNFIEQQKKDKIKKEWAINNTLMFMEFNEKNKYLIDDTIEFIKTNYFLPQAFPHLNIFIHPTSLP